MTASTENKEQVINRSVWNPSDSLFKSSARDRARCTTIRCSLPSCPLLALGTCTFVSPFGWHRCPYGFVRVEEGPTKRAGSCWEWCDTRKKEFPEAGHLGIPAKKLAFIGEYVYLPYVHMDMNEAVPFLKHSGFMWSGQPFLPRTSWTIDTVQRLLAFRPQAMMGGEIVSYQKEEVPKFLAHLREADAEMWALLVKERPELDKPANYVGRKALLQTLVPPIEWMARDDWEYPVRWRWDGERVTTCSEDAYAKTWCNVPLDSLELSGVPSEDATIVVRNNAWVNENTVFVD